MELTGTVVSVLPEVGGTSKTGNPWRKQEFILEIPSQFPKKVCISLWGDRVEVLKSFNMGDAVTASVDVESREFNGRWFTEVRAWKVEKAGAAAPTNEPMNAFSNVVPPVTTFSSDANDDLPF